MPRAAACWYILLYIPPRSVLRVCRPLWYLVRGIVLYRLVGSLIVLSVVVPSVVVLWHVVATLVGRLSWSVVPAGYSCRWSYRLVAPPAVGRRACSLLLSVVLSCLLLVGCLIVPRVATARPPWVPSGGPTGDPQEGGRFFKKGGEADRNPPPSPFLCARSKKMWFFSAKRGKFNLER